MTTSGIEIETNFVNVQVTSTSTNARNLNSGATIPAAGLDFTGSGPVSGSGFTANVSGTLTSGTANGSFYGPQAQEAGGTFRTSGGGVTYVGAFGAKR
jgi:hypothetical protein